MIFSNISKQLNISPLYDFNDDINIEGVYIGDLLSIVMSKAKANFVWITIQTHINTIAVAELLDLSCIIVVEGMEVENEIIEKAKELSIPIFKTNESAYEIACRLNRLEIK